MLKEFDDAKDTDIKLTNWEARNKKYIQQLIMQKKQAQIQSQHAAEQEQKRKLRLSRRVLGTSFQRLQPQQSAAISRTLEAGSNSGSDSDAGCGACPGPGAEHVSKPKLARIDSHSQIPKLPRLTDAVEAAVGASTDEQHRHSGASPSSADGASAAGTAGGCGGGVNAAGQTYVRHIFQLRVGGGSLRAPNQLSRSVSAQRTGVAHLSSYYGESNGTGSGAASYSRNPPQSQRQTQNQDQHLKNRQRRSTFPDPPTKPVREAANRCNNDPNDSNGCNDDDDGPDIALSDRRTARRGKLLRSQPPTQPQAPALGVGARSSMRLAAAASFPPTPAGYMQWRVRTRLPDGQRTFCIAGTGNHSQGIRAGLLARGWYENPDRNSPFFDFKWAANPLDINHDTLWPGQIVNHFRHSTCLTTKHGLCYTVRDTVWYEAADAAAFYPRAYDITDEASRREFMQDVRWTAAESLIKRAVIDGAVCTTHVPYSPRRKSINHAPHQQQLLTIGKTSPVADAAANASVGSGNGEDGSGGGGGGGGGGSEGSDMPPAGDDSGGRVAYYGGGCDGDVSGDGGGGEGMHRLQQRADSMPLVDLPSLRLACRVVAARMRHQRHLRVVHESRSGRVGGRSGGCGRGGCEDTDEPLPDVELSAVQWQQLVKHKALSCSAPVLPQPQFDPSWIHCRSFITSALLPPQSSTPGRAKRTCGGGSGGGGGGGSSGRNSRASRKVRDPQRRRRRRGGNGGAGTGTDGETGGGTGSDDEDTEGSNAGDDGGRPSASASFAATGPAEDIDTDADARSTVAAARPSGPVAVVDAAELLREVYGKARRGHSAPPPHRRQGGISTFPAAAAATGAQSEPDTAGDLDASLSVPVHTSSSLHWGPSRRDVGDDRDAGGDSSNGGDSGDACASVGPSWLPEDLPAICYDDAALQALDFDTWREAAVAILGALEGSAVQTHISGTNNIWIVKPAGKSRGRGIRLFNDPDTMLSYVRGEEAQGLESRWIAQKYVERPLIISRRKFDIRQWVLVTGWNPLQAWFYSTCYLRFAADDYDPNNLDIFQHLTNNSVSKYYEGPKKEDEITAAGNMWSIPRFQQWLAEVYGRDDIWQVLLQPAMRHIAICTLKSAQDHITPRKGSCQLYGYDFLIDDQLRVWLLEVNSSPTLEPSTPITAQLCADVQEDILKVVVDLPEQQAAAARRQECGAGDCGEQTSGDPGINDSGCGSLEGLDTGKWECIIDGGEELRQPQYTGLNLELKGTAIQLNPPRSNFAGRLYAATRQQQHQHQPTSAGVNDIPASSGGGGSGGRIPSSDDGVTAITIGRPSGPSVAAATMPSPRAVTPSPSTQTPGGGALDQHERQQLLLQQQQPYFHLQQQQQLLLLQQQQQQPNSHHMQCAMNSGEEDAIAAAATSAATSSGAVAMQARVHTGTCAPSSSRCGRASPARSRTPRLSASPALSTHWDSGGFVLGSFGDPMGAISTLACGGSAATAANAGGGNGSPLHPSSRITTPRNDVAIASLSVGTPLAAAATAVTPVWLPMSPTQSLDSLTPTTMRMSLLARPGHHNSTGLTPTGVRAR
ncbi:hypothetical protein Vretimale_3168 [Volvox reticuliferus]|uniref:Tubulin tyrosine ligase n=1 Tax=Volvox reticuliferus TaxID=1737510 RepID=A0A8J4C958_9CHLO|nr:hypothetical protein Vretifemale_6576 [Volvox reticuliferus]GIL97522.1 hypothetical protein Vretimale_3168 [Volvox reticuliferus]